MRDSSLRLLLARLVQPVRVRVRPGNRVWYSLCTGYTSSARVALGGSVRPVPATGRVGLACSGKPRTYCVQPGTQPLLARVELLGQRVVLTSLEMVAVVERPRRDGTGGRRAAVEEAALMRTSHASDESCQPWRCQPSPDHAAAFQVDVRGRPRVPARRARLLEVFLTYCNHEPSNGGPNLESAVFRFRRGRAWNPSPPSPPGCRPWLGRRGALGVHCPPRRWVAPRRSDARRTPPTSGDAARTASSSRSSARSLRRDGMEIASWLGLRPAGSLEAASSARQIMPQAAPSLGQPWPVGR